MKKTEIGIFVAMQEEAEVIAKDLGFKKEKVDFCRSQCVYFDDDNIALITPNRNGIEKDKISRVGKSAAAQTTALLIERFQPKLIINAGTAGGLSNLGAKIGDVYTGSIQQHDIFFPFPQYQKWASRVFSTIGPDIAQLLGLPLKEGLISSGESFDKSQCEWEIIHRTKAIVIEMEAIAVADVVFDMMPHWKEKILCFPLKGISDVGSLETVDDKIDIRKAASDFEKNLSSAMKNVTQMLKMVLNRRDKILNFIET